MHLNKHLLHTIEKIKTNKKELFLQILAVFILPVFFINIGFINIHYRVTVLAVLVTLLVIVLVEEDWSAQMLGMSKFYFKKYLVNYFIFSAIGVFAIVKFGHEVGHHSMPLWWQNGHFVYLFFIISALQEIAYRGYMMPALGKLTKNPYMIVLANTLIFTYLHTIFPDLGLGLPLAFVGGIGFSFMYLKYPSLPLIILSHSILNFFAVLYGFFNVN